MEEKLMEALLESIVVIFSLQAVLLVLYIPLTYVAYGWIHAPMKRNRVVAAMWQLGLAEAKDWREVTKDGHSLRYFIWPMLGAIGLTMITFALTHPVIAQSNLRAGILEEVIDVFGADDLFPRTVPVGRFLFWGWLGAYLYSFYTIIRRFMDYDLTPNVYVFTANRFLLAFVLGGMVGIALGTFSRMAGLPFDTNLATVSVVAFFIGFFPEQGLNWITATAQKALQQQGGIVRETRLAEIEGMSIWQQGRLKQENIDNVQNLATADIPELIMMTPFTVNQIIDWIDQAILLIHTVSEQLQSLARAGVSRASELLANTADEASLADLVDATGLKASELRVLCRVLQSASNIKIVTYFVWGSSLDEARVAQAALIHPEPIGPHKYADNSKEPDVKLAKAKAS
jgi:hypothetical protein